MHVPDDLARYGPRGGRCDPWGGRTGVHALLARVAPGRAQAVAVTEPQDRGDDEQHGLVERSRDRRDSDGCEPAEPTRQPAVAGEDADGS